MKRFLVRSGFTEMKYDTGRVLINYVKGPPGDTPILLIPGQTLPWESYTRVLNGLSKHFEVYAVDVHGHGRSGWIPDGEYRFSSMGADLVSMLTGSDTLSTDWLAPLTIMMWTGSEHPSVDHVFSEAVYHLK